MRLFSHPFSDNGMFPKGITLLFQHHKYKM
jgi:hypothetical protein